MYEFETTHLGIPVRTYVVVFYNRFANETQTWEVVETSEFRAGRAFYRKYDRQMYFSCIESIHTVGGR